MDQRRFRSLGMAGVLLAALALNGRTLIAAFSGDYSPEYVLMRYSGVVVVGYIGLRVMDSILFRPERVSSGGPKRNPSSGIGSEPLTIDDNPSGVSDAEETVS